MKLQNVFTSLVLSAGMIPAVSFAQANCSTANICPTTTCVISQNAQNTVYTMVYRLSISNMNSCVMTRSSNNDRWPFPSYIKTSSNDGYPGNKNRTYYMARREVDKQPYTVTNTPSTFVCARDVVKNSANVLRSTLDYNFDNKGDVDYDVTSAQLPAELCSAKAAAGAITAAELATITTACGPSAPLPVELTVFNAVARTNGVALSWTTASEKNSANFEIQRSKDGASFATIGAVAAAGSSTTAHNYSFLDNSVLSGTIYYRLKQNDLDATSNYSPVKAVSLNGNTQQAIYPNPVVSGASATLAIQSGADQAAVVTVYSLSGAIVAQQSISLQAGSQSITVESIAALKPGQYVVTVQTQAGERTNHRLSVQ